MRKILYNNCSYDKKIHVVDKSGISVLGEQIPFTALNVGDTVTIGDESLMRFYGWEKPRKAKVIYSGPYFVTVEFEVKRSGCQVVCWRMSLNAGDFIKVERVKAA